MTKTYYKTPLGAGSRDIPFAKLASTITSINLVSDAATDAPYFRSLEKQGILLNEPQIQAVRHFRGPLLTLAGAGSGKTSVLVSRTGYLINIHHVNPRNILLVTFTKKAAEEMKNRISLLPGISKAVAHQIQASTFHSFFLRILKHHGYDQEILGNERFKQLIIKQTLKEMNLQDAYQPETLLSQLSSYKMNLVDLNQIPDESPVEKELKSIFVK